jgi:hypothetical protein
MKKIMTIFGAVFYVLIILTSYGGSAKNIEICKCLTEPGDSEYIQENNDACRDAISKELGVDNWEKVNMRQNPDISAKFDVLAKRCL